MEKRLHNLRGAVIPTCGDDGGGHAFGHFGCQRRAGHRHNASFRRILLEDVRHGVAGFKFDALRHAHDNSAERVQTLGRAAKSLRHTGNHDQFRASHCLGRVSLRPESSRQLDAGKITLVASGLADGFNRFREEIPERDLVFARGQHAGERRSPGAGTKNGDFHEAVFSFLKLMRLSVPARSR